ncbi:MAG: hypothetical protein EOS76_01490 [Mesorhizobium sp.]|uniref:hypothetical protein n=1 Tax=unclassified Mesorhizobium TaxID=325217 RepID=UPI000F759EB6|nr:MULTISPECIES: hypothetical protein [unclassified Mesorhizobium]AZO34188.1 hypothetical protein EJ072_06690 [Mesorhizobium sp. M2A.F.Ca.ET.046.03.2.1]RVC82323.1 hypothetical protein EN766_01320 [Mesorhizobium sp. M2A.F.Ca.ET.046.02.1.1]AZO71619.1 hypothetical protein EJ067_11070 [Mesorhizobium sp. M1D.F.Ca.ET.043.01.1.1]RWB49803.1 MAG: hypothetical protein EOQ44_01400 [Mesorhizobium sp.]RWE22512.1 MAG: hypothetical protein EOS76_01490 [Mesorhizobium sp.]
MTCIVGLVSGKEVLIGGDSAGVSRLDLIVRSDSKVFRNGPFVIGFTTSFRMGQLLAHSFTPPVRRTDQDVYAFMVTDFVNEVRACLKNGGYAVRVNEAEKGGDFLVAYEGRLFVISSDYQVGENMDGIAACGCGAQIALGAMFATPKVNPKERVILALQAAENFSAGVRGPFLIVSSKE